jgi:two-component system response regulator VicR
MSRVLVVEDDAAILRGLADNLDGEGYEVRTARSGEEGLRIIRDEHPDLVVLDLMLPGMSGFEVCRRVRREANRTPILVLTARGEEVDRVTGLDLGADDYVTKPFSVAELLARVRALLRRAQPSMPLPERVAFDDVIVDFVRYEATKAGRPVQLAPKEYAALRYLAARPDVVIHRADLLLDVWGYHQLPTTRTVDNHVALLRAKLEDDPAEPKRILTVHGVGYKLVLEDPR